jgi:hypothetical protein
MRRIVPASGWHEIMLVLHLPCDAVLLYIFLWARHYLKSHYWSNHAHANWEAFEAAAIEAWRHLALDTEQI